MRFGYIKQFNVMRVFSGLYIHINIIEYSLCFKSCKEEEHEFNKRALGCKQDFMIFIYS